MKQEFFEKQCLGFLNTPPLWVKAQFGIQQFEFPKIDFTGFRAAPIPARISLGHQMEYAFEQLLTHSKCYEVVLHNLPVKEDNRTIGEIDFIVRDVKSAKLVHVELTYKLYIIDPEISEPIHRLIGPNKSDRFFTKMEKIKNQQFQLLHSKEGRQALSDKGIDHDSIEHTTCFKAQLFKPFSMETISIHPLNKACICGYWLRVNDFNTPVFQQHQFYLPYKSQWVIDPHAAVAWTSHYEVLLNINLRMLQENAPMVWMKKSETEFEKFFVVWW